MQCIFTVLCASYCNYRRVKKWLINCLICRSASALLEDCYELLLLISSASESGAATFFECGGLKLLAAHLSCFPDGIKG